MSEWNLSDKIGVNFAQYYDAILDKDVKEFIKRLKELPFLITNDTNVLEEIDKLAGEKLI